MARKNTAYKKYIKIKKDVPGNNFVMDLEEING